MKKISLNAIHRLFFFVLLTAFTACRQQGHESVTEQLKTEGLQAGGPYLIRDNLGRPVLCWTERSAADSLNRLKFAVFNIEKARFDTAVTVDPSAGCSDAAESMAKIGYKADGSMIAVFSKRFPDEKNPYAGAIYYSQSADGGRHWSDARFIHSDTAHVIGRSFFDLARLKNGELGAVWLDGRYAKTIKGSALFFNRTSKGKGFGQDTCLQKGTCECCRTNIVVDPKGFIHVAYRSIFFPSLLSGKQVRDMAYLYSPDNGSHFTSQQIISKDNWEIEACPHSGPTLAWADGRLNAVWFTGGGGSGLYYTSRSGDDPVFRSRHLLTRAGRHPQIARMNNGAMAMVCEEGSETVNNEHVSGMSHSMGAHAPAAASKIVLRMFNAGLMTDSLRVTDGSFADHHAVLSPTGQGLILAWVREGKSGSKICYRVVSDLH